mgnify:CR=1 FL=1
MDARGLLEQMLQAGRSLASQGRDMGEQKLGVPQDGPERDAMLSGMGKGALAAGALGLLFGTKSGRKLGGSALKVGSLAALGGVAYKVYRDWQSQDAAGPVALQDPGLPVDRLPAEQAERRSLLLLRAMVSAAQADGHVDDDERRRIQQGMEQLELDSDARNFLQQELAKPADPAALASQADSPEAAAEVYLASLLAVNVDNYMERGYLDELAKQLGLSPELISRLEAEAQAAA